MSTTLAWLHVTILLCSHDEHLPFSMMSQSSYRIAGNFRWSKFSRKSHFPSRRNFRKNPISPPEEIFTVLIFTFSTGYWPRPFIVAGITGTEDVPWERIGHHLSVWIDTVPSSDRPRLAHKTYVWKFLRVEKFTQKFTKFSRFLFSRFGRGLRKLRKFGPCENFPLYGSYTVNNCVMTC